MIGGSGECACHRIASRRRKGLPNSAKPPRSPNALRVANTLKHEHKYGNRTSVGDTTEEQGEYGSTSRRVHRLATLSCVEEPTALLLARYVHRQHSRSSWPPA